MQEFASRPRSYYEEAFEDGRLRIEGGQTPAQADTPLKDNHRMRHFIHRHEPPVLDRPIEVPRLYYPVLDVNPSLILMRKLIYNI